MLSEFESLYSRTGRARTTAEALILDILQRH